MKLDSLNDKRFKTKFNIRECGVIWKNKCHYLRMTHTKYKITNTLQLIYVDVLRITLSDKS